MKILKIYEQYFCKTKCGFVLQKLEANLDEHLGMRMDSFAEQYSKRIFHDFFLYARDLRKEYEDYYVQEYDSFEQFLYQKELWKRSDIDMLELELDQTVLELRPDLINYNANTLINYGENGANIINQVLEKISL